MVLALFRRKFFVRRTDPHGQQALHADRFDLPVPTVQVFELNAA
jgi:hypothetical protein